MAEKPDPKETKREEKSRTNRDSPSSKALLRNKIRDFIKQGSFKLEKSKGR